MPSDFNMFEGTTILGIRHGGKVVVVGDGQVSLGQTVMKHSARKVRKLHHDRVIAGFAGATADAFTLFEKFEAKLEQFNGNLNGRRWNWPKIGARIACCGGSKHC